MGWVMAAMELTTAYVTIAAEGSELAPSFARAFKTVEKQSSEAGKRMGRALAGQVSKATSADIDKARAAYEQAAKKVTATVEQQALKVGNAKRKEEIAYAKVVEAQAQAEKQLASISEAEKRYIKVVEESGAGSEVAARAHKLVAAEQARHETAARKVLEAEDRLALAAQKTQAALLEQESATGRANKALADAEGELKRVEAAAGKAEKPFISLGDRIRNAFKGDFKGIFSPFQREAEQATGNVAGEFGEAGGLSGGLFSGALASGLGALAGVAASAGVTFGAAFVAAVEQEATAGKMAAALGIDKKSAAGLARDAAGIYAGGFGADSTSSADALIQARQILPEEDAAQVAKMALTLQDAFGYDTQESISAVSQMLRTDMADSATEAFDAITRGSQSGADVRDDLLDTIREYGVQFQKLGIDGPEAMGLLSQGLQAGARDSDKVADSLKELSIRAVDGSDTTRAAYQALGMDADDMAARFAAGGDTASSALSDVLTGLRDMEDPVARTSAAVGLFGTQAEDLGGALFALDPSTATDGMKSFAGATDEAAQSLRDSQSPMDILQRGFSGIMSAVGTDLAPAITVLKDALRDVFAYVQDTVIPALADFGGWVQQNREWLAPLGTALGVVAFAVVGIVGAMALWSGVTWAMTAAQSALNLALLANPITWVVIGIAALVAGLVVAYRESETFRNIVNAAWNGIKSVIGVVVDWITGTVWPALQAAWQLIADAAMWLWQSVIQPVWTGIRVAIALVVAAVMTYVQGWVAFFQTVVAPMFTWLWQSVIVPVWNGIKSAVFAVVSWFQGTAWPVISRVIGFITSGFTMLKDAVGRVWSGIRSFISPVVDWFSSNVWPKISGVIENIKRGFNIMKDAVSKVWTGIQDAAKKPINFIINTVYNKGIKANFDKIAGTFGLKPLPEFKGFARGGILPGWSRMANGDDQLVPLRRGEGVLVSEALRTQRDRAAFLAVNAAGRKGIGFSDVLAGTGFAKGGIFDWVGDTWDWVKDKAGKVWDFVSDPVGAFKALLDRTLSAVPGVGLFLDLAKGISRKVIDGVTGLLNFGGGSAAPVGPVPAGASRSLGYAQQVARSMGLTMTSGKRGGARTSSGIVSLHALGRAMDFSNSSGPTPQMMAFFNAMHPLKPTELLYSPAGARQWNRSGKMHDTTGTTKRIHYNHVHVGFAGGGIYSPVASAINSTHITGGVSDSGLSFGGVFDRGGLLLPGEVGVNLSGRPELVLNPSQTAALDALLSRPSGRGDRSPVTVNVTSPASSDPGVFGQRVGEALELRRLAGLVGV